MVIKQITHPLKREVIIMDEILRYLGSFDEKLEVQKTGIMWRYLTV